MKKEQILIISSKFDPHSDYVINKINCLGFGDKVVRFNTEDLYDNCILNFSFNKSYLHFKDSERTINIEQIKTVWYRRPKEFKINEEVIAYKKYIFEQTNAALNGFYFATHINSKWINPLDVLYKARLKIQQLFLAKKIGFKIPDTIVTNSQNELLIFFKKHNKISNKSLDYPNAKIEGQLYPLYNRIIEKDIFIENLDSIKYCPGLFQEYIDKVIDIRVVIIGEIITAFAIYSQENESTIVDVRGTNPINLKHELYDLPKDLLKKIRIFIKEQGLIFSSMDLILGKNGFYYFLENNPNGQWVWLEEVTGYELSKIFIDELYK